MLATDDRTPEHSFACGGVSFFALRFRPWTTADVYHTGGRFAEHHIKGRLGSRLLNVQDDTYNEEN